MFPAIPFDTTPEQVSINVDWDLLPYLLGVIQWLTDPELYIGDEDDIQYTIGRVNQALCDLTAVLEP